MECRFTVEIRTEYGGTSGKVSVFDTEEDIMDAIDCCLSSPGKFRLAIKRN